VADQDVFLQRALLEDGLVDNEQLDAARRHAAEHDVDLVDALVATEAVTSRQIALTKADICEVPYIELADYEPCYANTTLVPRAICERHCAFPLFMLEGVLTVVMDDPLDLDATDQIRRIAMCEVDAVLAGREQIQALIAKAYSLGHAQAGGTPETQEVETDVEDGESSQPVVAAVNQMLADAAQQRASDIHINPDEHELHLRYRVDGVLHEKQGPPLSMHAGIVQRLKVMAHLDLTQTRRPQDGKFRFRHGSQTIDVRMSTMPTVCGENVVLRLLASAQTYQDFLELGMPAPLSTQLEESVRQPHGMLLVTGPTGSGKTTTLYTALSKLNDPSRNIMTIEDPVEIRLPYVRQIQVNHEINLTFASALRSILRQDPDIVLVGEIRDNETATIALQAALTGHLVLSTLHTNDAVGAISRLRDYGLPPFVINSAVLGVMAQRLVRRVCRHCVVPDTLNDVVRHRFGLDANADGFVRGKGCSRCAQSGYRGRVGLYEFLRFTPEVKRHVEAGASADRIRDEAVRGGMRLMWQEGLEKARLGHTTLAEVTKVATVTEIAGPAATPVAPPSPAKQERMIA
jgi:type IV pilus assembly protein PilB